MGTWTFKSEASSKKVPNLCKPTPPGHLNPRLPLKVFANGGLNLACDTKFV